ncbi:SlyX family protein [Simplicispira lacusdiani]|uniref:SlyX family protein n=1 Tax=Simplicispira lacusdiani TaxID=2213010 RepID=UPI000E770626|nr:SlyX family protein [Simplicispira lacusdiani]
MDHPNPADERLTELEIKVSYQEDLLEQLNLTVYRQQQQIDRLVQEIAHLRQQMPEPGGAAPRNLRDEIPPHY